MERLLRHKLVIGLVAVLVLAGGGAAYAATQTASSPRQALLNDVAKRLNVSPAKLRSAIQGALIDRLQAAVRAGRLTQAQANAIKQRIEQGGLPFGPGGPWLRHLAPGGGFWLHGPRLRPFGLVAFPPVLAATRYLGISPAQLLKDLRGGKTLAQVARAHGKSVSGLEQAIVSAQKTRLNRLVAAGLLTKAQEQRRLTFLGQRVVQLVEHARIMVPPTGKLMFPGGGPGAELPPGGGPGAELPPGGPAANVAPGPPMGGPGGPLPPAA